MVITACAPLTPPPLPPASPLDQPLAEWTRNIPLLLPAIQACLVMEAAQPAVIADARQLSQGQAAITVRDANAVFTGCLYDDRSARVVGREPIQLSLEEKHYSVFFSPIERWFPGGEPCNAVWNVRDLQQLLIGWTFVTDCQKRREGEQYYLTVIEPRQEAKIDQFGENFHDERNAQEAARYIATEFSVDYPDMFVPRDQAAALEIAYRNLLGDLFRFINAFKRGMEETSYLVDPDEAPFWQNGLVFIFDNHFRHPPSGLTRNRVNEIYQAIIDQSDDYSDLIERGTLDRSRDYHFRPLPPTLYDLSSGEDFDSFSRRIFVYVFTAFRFDPEGLRQLLNASDPSPVLSNKR